MASSYESRWLVYTEKPLDCFGIFETEATALKVCAELEVLRDADAAAQNAWQRHPLVEYMSGLWSPIVDTPAFRTKEIFPV